MPFRIIRNDITRTQADAIVNTANPDPVFGSGTDMAVYKAAGEEQLLAERRRIGAIRPGETAVTPAFALPAKYIIHTVGPVWQDGKHGEYEILSDCYRNSLETARSLGCESIAFPLISSGSYGFPKARALAVALEMISGFLEENEMDVTLVVFDRKAFELSSTIVSNVSRFIDDHYVEESHREVYGTAFPDERRAERRRRRQDAMFQSNMADTGELPDLSAYVEASNIPYEGHVSDSLPEMSPLAAPAGRKEKKPAKTSLEDALTHRGETFQECLLRLIDERGFTDVEVYKRANVDRKLFSKIRCTTDYTPKKKTAVAFALALELDMEETSDLLRRAGLALSPSSKFDLIVEYCIRHHIYNTFSINALLFEYDQPMLGC